MAKRKKSLVEGGEDVLNVELDDSGEIKKPERTYIPGYEQKISKFVNIIVWVSIVCILIMLCITAVDVVARSLVRWSIPGVYEYSKFLMVFIAAVALPYTALNDGHVEVDMVTRKMPNILQRFFGVLNFVAVTCYCAILAVENFLQAGMSKSMGQRSADAEWIMQYPFYYIISAGLVIMLVVVLMKAVNYVRRVY